MGVHLYLTRCWEPALLSIFWKNQGFFIFVCLRRMHYSISTDHFCMRGQLPLPAHARHYYNSCQSKCEFLNKLKISRVVRQSDGERNFHIFYYLLCGMSEAQCLQLKLKDILSYHYLRGGNALLTRDQSIDIGNVEKVCGTRKVPRLKNNYNSKGSL